MILTYTRVPAEGFDEFLADEPAVLALTTELQLSTEDLAALAEQQRELDPSSFLPALEGRWSGEQPTFSLEQAWGHLQHLLNQINQSQLSTLITGGRATHIYTEHGPLRVLSPSQVQSLNSALKTIELSKLKNRSNIIELIELQVPPLLAAWNPEAQAELWTLYPALQKFFGLASEAEEFVITAIS